MIDWRRITGVFKAIAITSLCCGLIGGLIAGADIAFGLSIGEWLFESSGGSIVVKLVSVVIFCLVVTTLFPSVVKDIPQRDK